MLNSSNSQSNTSNNNITDESRTVTHFIILVPGTGPHREDERPKGSFLKKAKRFREIFQETCKREFADTDAYVEMMPIDYHADIQALETTNQRMIKATLPSIPWIRTMDNEVIGDILYYFSTFHGRIMLKTVINKLNAAYDTFMTSNPAFSGSISLVAHSLGGLICYEILYYMDKLNSEEPGNFGAHEAQRYMGLPSLRFSPDRLFTLGSPMGGGMVFRNQCMTEYHMGAVGLPSNSANMSSDDKNALTKTFFEERVRQEIDSSDDNDSGGAGVSRSASSSSIVSISMKSHLAATMGAMAASTSAAESPSPPALRPSGERARSAEPDARRQSSRRNGSMTPDDMLDQLMHLFGPSRPPDRDQQMAESQGLPLSSRLMAARELGGTRAGAPIRDHIIAVSTIALLGGRSRSSASA
ncbi:hypothetical protein BX661DRAFT_173405 [Kickxella alabastrina]|uniref:uncharacterized protein n=1 Tax=Kickxella alabastrina TaxID=61397 RepID=UPI00221FB5C0|nr:uncharacterized protein BX661DRAFT_173405 [Kickxella alabastrina]KAI7821294.1 hypothetical protein BX661DRAFT_173405 [Kickxella alabastrina]